jgi:hypothetical protein
VSEWDACVYICTHTHIYIYIYIYIYTHINVCLRTQNVDLFHPCTHEQLNHARAYVSAAGEVHGLADAVRCKHHGHEDGLWEEGCSVVCVCVCVCVYVCVVHTRIGYTLSLTRTHTYTLSLSHTHTYLEIAD